jgi:hypothetical protein
MKVVQTRITPQEYALLKRHAKASGRSLQDALREAIRLLVLSEKINPRDPLFTLPPAGPRGRRRTNLAEEHDRALYGA